MAEQDPSPQTTLLILLGASSWPLSELGSSPAFEHAVRDLQAYFLSDDPYGFHLPKSNVLDLFDSEDSGPDILNRISVFLKGRLAASDDVRDIFVYYVGHGGITKDSSTFYLAIRHTHKEYEKATSIAIDDLAERLKKGARFQRRILILDCCFAAQALSSFQGPTPATLVNAKTIAAFKEKDQGEGVPSRGTSFLASSGKNVASIILPDETSTMFTSALLSALRTGDPYQKRERLTLSTIYRLTEDFLRKAHGENFPQPELHSPDQSEGIIAETIAFFPNPRTEDARVQQAEVIRANEATKALQVWKGEKERIRKAEVADLTEKVLGSLSGEKAPRPELHLPDQSRGNVAVVLPYSGVRERQPSLICPQCQYINRPGAKYCIKDRQPLTLGISVQSESGVLLTSSMPSWQDTNTLQAVAFCTLQGHISSVHRVAWSPDGKYLASAGSDKKVFVWEVRTGQRISLYRGHSDEVLCVAWSPDGKHIASGGKDGTVHVWDAVKARSVFVHRPQHSSDLPFWIQAVAWSPQPGDKRIASSGGSSTDGIQIWKAFTGQVLLTYREHPEVTRSLVWSSNGERVASGGGRKIHVWDTATGNSMLTYRGHAKAISDVAWSPDKQRIASCGDRAVQIRMARDGKHICTYKGHAGNVSTVTWSPDGRYLASAGGGTVQIWEADTGTLMKKIDISLRSAREYAAWSPKDLSLALTGESNTIEIWHIF